MRPADRELDDEIRGHLALSVKERIECGEDPEAARLAALREFGYIPQMRDSMRSVWHSRWLDQASDFAQDVRVGLRSLMRAKGLAATVIVTLALGIGANAAIFSVVRGVLLRPLVNRGEDRLIYIRQSAPGVDVDNMTFSVPEIDDFRSRATTIAAFGEFSTVDFTMIGFGEPRVVHAGVVNGSYFDVIGLRPVLGRLINPGDDGRDAAGVAVLTHRFWSTALMSDPSVVGRAISLGARPVTVVGVLEPSVPYPDDTEIIANIVTSPHHLGATMSTQRTHRMTELFGRLATDASMEDARAELVSIHGAMLLEHPEAYSVSGHAQVTIARLREQIASPARAVLLVLLAASAVVFVIACSNVANLILARSVRREGELAVRAALGASRGALRRTLLAESLVLCGAGAVLGVALARPLVGVVAQFAARFSVRALEVGVDAGMLWLGAGLPMAAAVLLAYVPRLPQHSVTGVGLAGGSVRITSGTNRRLRAFATVQIAFSFVLLAGAGTLIATLIALHRTNTGYDMQQVLAIDLPMPQLGFSSAKELDFYQEITRRIGELPGVEGVALGNFVPWRDADGTFSASSAFAAEGYTPASGEESPHARLRIVGPGFFDVMGIRLSAGRGFTADDRRDSEPVVMVSESIARRLFPNGDALDRTVWWTDPYFGKPLPRRIVGVVDEVDDQHVAAGPAPTIYHPLQQMRVAGRLFVRADSDPYALVEPVTRIVREMSPNQPVERAATLEDVRADVLAPERLNAFVFSGFAGVALLIAVVGVAGVLAFGVSARTREFGVRLAVGSSPRHLLLGVLSEGAAIVAVGVLAGAAGGYAFALLAANYFDRVQLPGALPVVGAATVLIVAAILASLLPAARASRVDVLQALRAE
ncbi:MAG: ADOP family duplicated permease [Vicinamibacterales bacterium]